MNNKITIAIDGFSSTGKSTVAKQLAGELGYIYVDTGAMYRAVTLYAMQNDFVSEIGFNKEALINKLPSVQLKFIFDPALGFGAIYLNGKKVEEEIRKMDVSEYVSRVAAVPEVREKLVHQQKIMGEEKGIVMDGRDIGTVVFPNAELKLFMTASAKERAGRRFKELEEKGQQVTYDEVLKNVEERDYLDTTRADSPLVKAEDAIEIDNDNLNIQEQFQLILRLAQEKISS